MTQGFRILRSTDGGAPVLNGTAGSMIGVLDELLDIGGGGTYWEKVYSGTNLAVYRSTVGERYYLRVDDTAAQVTGVRGYTSMSDVNTGSDIFPTTTQQTNWNWRKSNTADSTSRAYVGVATDRFFLLLVTGGWSGSGQMLGWFGEAIRLIEGVATTLRADPVSAISGVGLSSGKSGAMWDNSSDYSAPGNNSGTMLPFARSDSALNPAIAGRFWACTVTSAMTLAELGSVQLFPVLAGSISEYGDGSNDGVVRVRIPHLYSTSIAETDAGAAAGDTVTDQSGASYLLATPSGTTALSANVGLYAVMTSDDETETV